MSAVIEFKEQESVAVATVTPMQMLARAISENADLAKLEKLMELEEKWQKAQAKRAYVTAFALFKKNMPDVIKDMLNKQYGSDYSSLANLVNSTNRVLGEYGLNASWRPDQTNGIKVTCILTHIDGHSEEVSLIGPPDKSGAKNPLQEIKSTLTYLEGATFQAITGVVARSASKDDDGNGAGNGVAKISEKQVADLKALAEEVGADKPAFMKYFDIQQLSDLPATKYSSAIAALNKKRNAK